MLSRFNRNLTEKSFKPFYLRARAPMIRQGVSQALIRRCSTLNTYSKASEKVKPQSARATTTQFVGGVVTATASQLGVRTHELAKKYPPLTTNRQKLDVIAREYIEAGGLTGQAALMILGQNGAQTLLKQDVGPKATQEFAVFLKVLKTAEDRGAGPEELAEILDQGHKDLQKAFEKDGYKSGVLLHRIGSTSDYIKTILVRSTTLDDARTPEPRQPNVLEKGEVELIRKATEIIEGLKAIKFQDDKPKLYIEKALKLLKNDPLTQEDVAKSQIYIGKATTDCRRALNDSIFSGSIAAHKKELVSLKQLTKKLNSLKETLPKQEDLKANKPKL